MKKGAIFGVLVGALLILAGGVAWAATVRCPAGGEECVGTGGPDTMYGTDNHDHMRGLEGDDEMYGLGGGDYDHHDTFDGGLYGGPGRDTLRGGESGDDLHGGRGSDDLRGGPGNDTLIGEEGYEFVDGDPAGSDLFAGGPGNDVFYAKDGEKDRIYCGRGLRDGVEADEGRGGGVRDYIDDSCESIH